MKEKHSYLKARLCQQLWQVAHLAGAHLSSILLDSLDSSLAPINTAGWRESEGCDQEQNTMTPPSIAPIPFDSKSSILTIRPQQFPQS